MARKQSAFGEWGSMMVVVVVFRGVGEARGCPARQVGRGGVQQIGRALTPTTRTMWGGSRRRYGRTTRTRQRRMTVDAGVVVVIFFSSHRDSES